MKVCLLFLAVFLTTSNSFCQDKSAIDKEASYTHTINARAEKIVKSLGICDSLKAGRVKNIIANQYRNLNDIQTLRDTQIKKTCMVW